MDRLVALVGPTAIGKSRLALQLAPLFNGEIVGADSRQVYRYMNLGTGKPTPQEMALVPHHLIDVVNPDEDFTLAHYQALAYQTIADIQQRRRLPLLVGGTGLYVRAVLEGWKVPQVAPDLKFRHELEAKSAEAGPEAIYKMLDEVDHEAARSIGPYNVRRMIRALEVYRQTKVPLSQLQVKEPPPFQSLVIGLTTERAALYRLVDARVDDMLSRGLVAEVQGLKARGYSLNLPSMSSLGYREIGLFLQGKLSLEEAVRRTKFETHRFVRHQYAWFRPRDERIHWFDIQQEPYREIQALVADFVAQG